MATYRLGAWRGVWWQCWIPPLIISVNCIFGNHSYETYYGLSFLHIGHKACTKAKTKTKNQNRKKPVSLLVYFKELVSSLKAFEYIR